jgi:hypothetical protein
MEEALTWWQPRRKHDDREDTPETGATERFGGDGDSGPVLVATVHGPVEINMARDALAEANIPAHIKQNSLGPVYGLSVGDFGSAEVWVPRPLAEQAQDLLIGIGLAGEPAEGWSDEAWSETDQEGTDESDAP